MTEFAALDDGIGQLKERIPSIADIVISRLTK